MLKKKLHKYGLEVKILLLVALLGVVSSYAFSKFRVKENTDSGPIQYYENKAFPDLGINNYENSKSLVSSVQGGTYLLIYVLSDCPACELEAKVIQKSKLQEKTGINLILIGAENFDSIENFRKDNNLTAEIFYDKDFRLRENLNVTSTPTNFLIRDGKIERSWGVSPVSVKELYQRLGVPE